MKKWKPRRISFKPMFLLSLLTNKYSYNTQIIQCVNDTIFKKKRFRVPGFGNGSLEPDPTSNHYSLDWLFDTSAQLFCYNFIYFLILLRCHVLGKVRWIFVSNFYRTSYRIDHAIYRHLTHHYCGWTTVPEAKLFVNKLNFGRCEVIVWNKWCSAHVIWYLIALSEVQHLLPLVVLQNLVLRGFCTTPQKKRGVCQH